MDVKKNFALQAALTFAKSESENAAPTFEMVANAGSVMEFEDGRIALDVDGIEARGESIPILYGHDFATGVGHSTSIEAVDGKLIVKGVVSRATDAANDFVQSSRFGFPWQASVGGYVRDGLKLAEGEEMDLHGNLITGPALVCTKFELFEVSVVEYGADSNTSSRVTAQREELNMNEEIKQEPAEVDVVEAVDAIIFDDGVAQIRARQADEMERIAEIRKRSNGNDEALQATAIREGWAPEKFELESLRASMASVPAVHTPETNVDAKALEVAAIRAAGFQPSEKRYSDQQLTAADKLGNVDFLEFCERATGAPAFSYRKDGWGKIKAAISTQNLGSVLTNTANAILLQAFDNTDQTWRSVFKISTVNDFKTAERWRIDSNFQFKEVPEGGEMEHADVADQKFEIKAKMWGRQFALSEQAIVNGDALGVFGDILRQIAFGSNEAISQECWSLFMNPATCGDGVAYYHASHASLKTSCALTLDNLSAARAAFLTRTKSKVQTAALGIPPQLLVVPTSLEDKALMLTKATTLNNGSSVDTPADYNPNAGRFRVVGAPSLELASFTNYSATTWYLLADPNRLAAFEIAFLNGRQAPIIRQDQMRIGTLGIEFDAHVAFGVAQEDYRGALKCTA